MRTRSPFGSTSAPAFSRTAFCLLVEEVDADLFQDPHGGGVDFLHPLFVQRLNRRVLVDRLAPRHLLEDGFVRAVSAIAAAPPLPFLASPSCRLPIGCAVAFTVAAISTGRCAGLDGYCRLRDGLCPVAGKAPVAGRQAWNAPSSPFLPDLAPEAFRLWQISVGAGDGVQPVKDGLGSRARPSPRPVLTWSSICSAVATICAFSELQIV